MRNSTLRPLAVATAVALSLSSLAACSSDEETDSDSTKVTKSSDKDEDEDADEDSEDETEENNDKKSSKKSDKKKSDKKKKSAAVEAGDYDGQYVALFSDLLDEEDISLPDDEVDELKKETDSGNEVYFFLDVDGEDCEISISLEEDGSDPYSQATCTIDYENEKWESSDPGAFVGKSGKIKFPEDDVIHFWDQLGVRLIFNKQ